jgi:hypothetical protein
VLAAEGGEVDAGDGAVALWEFGGGDQGYGVQDCGGAAQGAETGRGAVEWDHAASRELFDQDQGWDAVQVGGEEAGGWDVVLGGELECRYLRAEAGGVLVGTHSQDHAALLAEAG